MIDIEIRGLDRLLKKLKPELIGKPLRDFFKRSAVDVQSNVRRHTPVDRTQLLNSMVYEIDKGEVPEYAKIGPLDAKPGSTLFFKARAMEFGTGRVGQRGVSHKSSHYPPPGALDLWARRHGFKDGATVARIIARRGGLRPRKMLQTGFKDSLANIKRYLSKLSSDIKSRWER